MMRFSIHSLLLALLAALLQLFVPPTTVRANEPYVHHLCSIPNYKSNPTYKTNLHKLMSAFTSQLTITNGFNRATINENTEDSVTGYALCRGDISQSACSKCLNLSTTHILRLCPDQVGALAWYDDCMLKFWPSSLPDMLNYDYMYKVRDPVISASNLGEYFEARNELLSFLEKKASMGNLTSKFAIGSINFTNSETMYALMQCVPDLNEDVCAKCLNFAMEKALFTVQNWRLSTSSCDVRVAPMQFYDDSVNAPRAYSLPPVTGNNTIYLKGNTHRYILAIIVLTICCAVLIATTCIFLYLMRPKKKIQSVNTPRSAFSFPTARVNSTGDQRPDQRGVGVDNARPIMEIPMLDVEGQSQSVSNNAQDGTSYTWMLKTPVEHPGPR